MNNFLHSSILADFKEVQRGSDPHSNISGVLEGVKNYFQLSSLFTDFVILPVFIDMINFGVLTQGWHGNGFETSKNSQMSHE